VLYVRQARVLYVALSLVTLVIAAQFSALKTVKISVLRGARGYAFRISGEIHACATDTLLMQWGVSLL
jgi:hypothetical protein